MARMVRGTKVAAEILGVSQRTIRNLIARGRFPGAFKIDPKSIKSSWMIPVAEIYNFASGVMYDYERKIWVKKDEIKN